MDRCFCWPRKCFYSYSVFGAPVAKCILERRDEERERGGGGVSSLC